MRSVVSRRWGADRAPAPPPAHDAAMTSPASASAPAASDELLLAEALVAAAFAYGDEPRRAELVRAFLGTLPELRGADVAALYREAVGNVRRHGAMARIRGLARLGSEERRRRCLVLAMDVAFGSGVLDDGEILDAMREALGVPEREARRYAAVLRVKYGAGRDHLPQVGAAGGIIPAPWSPPPIR